MAVYLSSKKFPGSPLTILSETAGLYLMKLIVVRDVRRAAHIEKNWLDGFLMKANDIIKERNF